MRIRLCAVLAMAASAALAQPSSDSPLAPPTNGPEHRESTAHAIVGATAHVAPGRTIENATIAFRDGEIVSVRAGAAAPDGYRVWDADGLHVYAGFIDAFVEADAPAPEGPGRHWNSLVTPDRAAIAGDALDNDARAKHRKLGFVAAHVAPKGGVFRGMGAVVSLANDPDDTSLGQAPVYSDAASHVMGFDTSNWSSGAYPTSHMGVMALVRQTVRDARWEAEQDATPTAISVLHTHEAPFFFDTDAELEILLARRLDRELDLGDMVAVGSGSEYRRLDAIKTFSGALVVPLRYPRTPDVFSVGASESVSLERLMAWEQAPTNVRRLLDAGVTTAITASKTPKGQKFHENLRTAIEQGLTEEDALAALTTTPASILGLEDTLGAIEPGKVASLVVASGPIFDEESDILDVWIDGARFEITKPTNDRFEGDWTMWVGDEDAPVFEMEFGVEDGKVEIDHEGNEAPGRKVKIDRDSISFIIDDVDNSDGGGAYVVSGRLQPSGRIHGTGLSPDGSAFAWTARPEEDDEDDNGDENGDDDEDSDDDAEDESELAPDFAGAPFGPYQLASWPPAQPKTLVIENATIWTSGPDGVLRPDGQGTRVVVRDGTIDVVTRIDRAAPIRGNDVVTIDASGMHLTPGLIDAHSHTGLFRFGVNEAGQAVTSECWIGDSLDPGFINWYRQLAGGVTTANLLHGSANPIGGQSQTVKVRWGAPDAESMFFEDAAPGIKFALGENVKQSNWGDNKTTRYPQTRMGVETIIRDRFTAAREYIDRGMETADGRVDLELQALAEILNGERRIHCHSYRQDEILMLCRVAEDFGFKIGTFQHGLEVYKVAETVREHAVGASLFSDWWAYKVEVQDAIPFAGPVQTEAGVLTSFNSDSDELARRMNLEAAKAVKYSGGRISPAEGLKFVTINPAIQLGIDDRVGSIEEGKDADLVLWTGDPLSTFSKPAHVWIDGREYFSLDADQAHRDRIASERERLIQKILAKGAPDPDDEDGEGDAEESDDGETVDSPPRLLARYARRMHEMGMDPNAMAPGDCGCGLIHSAIRADFFNE